MAAAADHWERHDGCCCEAPPSSVLQTIGYLFLAAGALIMIAVVVAARIFDLIVRLVIWLVELIVWLAEKYRTRPRPPTRAERLVMAREKSAAMERAAGLYFGPDGSLLP